MLIKHVICPYKFKYFVWFYVWIIGKFQIVAFSAENLPESMAKKQSIKFNQLLQMIILIILILINLCSILLCFRVQTFTRIQLPFDGRLFVWSFAMITIWSLVIIIFAIHVTLFDNNNISYYSDIGFHLFITIINDFILVSYLFFIQFRITNLG